MHQHEVYREEREQRTVVCGCGVIVWLSCVVMWRTKGVAGYVPPYYTTTWQLKVLPHQVAILGKILDQDALGQGCGLEHCRCKARANKFDIFDKNM